jgi:hypothetical protein
MAFELSAYHANLTKHWKNEKTPADELDARLWDVGQAASAASSLALLADRAGNPNAPWPELSEYDCFACHHDLADPSWRQLEFDPSAGVSPGAAAWGTWHYSMLSEAQVRGFDELRAEMQRLLPRRDEVRGVAEEQRRKLTAAARAAAEQPLGPDARNAMLLRLTRSASMPAAENWDAAAQRFLACTALNFSAQTPTIEDALRQIRELLEFSDDSDGPRYESPQNQSVDRRSAVREAFEAIHQAASSLP